MECALAGGIQLFLEPRRLGVEIFFFHPTQERLPGNFTGVGIAFRELLFDERLDRFRHRYFHRFNLHDLVEKTIENSYKCGTSIFSLGDQMSTSTSSALQSFTPPASSPGLSFLPTL